MLETRVIGTLAPESPTFVFLHEGLGSVSAWRSFPQRICDACGIAGILYSRHGYGQSPEFDQPLSPEFMHQAALTELRGLVDRFGLQQPILFGHSDGGSIALIYAAEFDGQEGAALATVAMAPHLFVEPICIESIQELKRQFGANPQLRAGLSQHHRNAEATFRTWTEIWLDPAFRQWDIRQEVGAISCPVLAVQGFDDGYGTMQQIDELASRAHRVDVAKLPDCGHSPHRDQPESVTTRVQSFLTGLL